jgi:hypothetical protein
MGVGLNERLPLLFSGLDVRFAADADGAGQKAKQMLADVLRGTARSFKPYSLP